MAANNEMKTSESIEFLTKIYTAWDNTEQRQALRTRPRRSIALDYIGLNPAQSQYIRSLAYMGQTQLIQLPVWFASHRLDTPCYAADFSVKIPQSLVWQCRGCDYIQLMKSQNDGGEIFPVKQYFADGTITLNKKFAKEWAPGSTVFTPVGWFVLSQEDKYSNTSGMVASGTLNFEFMKETAAPMIPDAVSQEHDEETQLLFGRDLPKVYNGSELFITPPDWANGFTANFKRNANRLDNKPGVFIYDVKSNNPVETRQLDFITIGRPEINNLQRFFCRQKGRLHSFYAPTWLDDIELVNDAEKGDILLYTTFPYFYKYYQSGERRKTILVFYRDGTTQILKVAGYSTDDTGTHGKIILSQGLKKPIYRRNVGLISFLCKYRFDTDVMTTNYTSQETAAATLTFAEVD